MLYSNKVIVVKRSHFMYLLHTRNAPPFCNPKSLLLKQLQFNPTIFSIFFLSSYVLSIGCIPDSITSLIGPESHLFSYSPCVIIIHHQKKKEKKKRNVTSKKWPQIFQVLDPINYISCQNPTFLNSLKSCCLLSIFLFFFFC